MAADPGWLYRVFECRFCGRGFSHIREMVLHRNRCSQRPTEGQP
jgi:hypothetical protein